VHVWCVNPAARQVLLQLRSPAKCSNPNKWDISCAGHIEAGETSLQGALKELHEELGIVAQPEDLRFLLTVPYSDVHLNGTYIDNELQDVYLYETAFPVSSLTLQPEEVTGLSPSPRLAGGYSCWPRAHFRHIADARWIGWDEFEAQLDRGDPTFVAVAAEEYKRLFGFLRQHYSPSA